MKAYYVEEATKGVTLWLVYANSASEAREAFRGTSVNVEREAVDSQSHPNGVRSVRRAPADDRED